MDRAQKSDFPQVPVNGAGHVIVNAPGGYSFHLHALDVARNGTMYNGVTCIIILYSDCYYIIVLNIVHIKISLSTDPVFSVTLSVSNLSKSIGT